ncbi:hypothetical protein KIW74_gp51 [Mycobacterium phage Kimona]|uniref:Uncharacterized protein n=1 Tax=Mycobacterium phage Kimona TaxID=2024295 RepID=A0A249XU63_9CAUD|nr:hypothetical protein KIW74_gp51 [Mycobacterium phage Kimona]ASZ75477.1 hypothetical protein PBI_KIMONA_41 [Mycobacterium phage Kimona]
MAATTTVVVKPDFDLLIEKLEGLAEVFNGMAESIQSAADALKDSE